MLRNKKDKGLILQLKPLKEANKLLILFSKDQGKLNLLVKGAGKILSKNSPSLDAGNYIDFTSYKSKSDLDLLLEVKLINDHSSLKGTTIGIGYIFYILEVVNAFSQPELATPSYFDEVMALLDLLDSDLSIANTALSYFQIRSLLNFGFQPLLHQCSVCDKQLRIDSPRIASIEGAIGYICQEHLSELANRNIIKDNILKVQKYLLHQSINDLQSIKLEDKDWKTLLSLQNNWLQSVIEKKISAFSMIDFNGN